MNLYAVEMARTGRPRQLMCGATDLVSATNIMHSIRENMEANGYIRTDKLMHRKLPVVMLAKDLSAVTLRVVELDNDESVRQHEGELRHEVALVMETAEEETMDYLVDPNVTPTDGLFIDELTSELPEVAQHG